MNNNIIKTKKLICFLCFSNICVWCNRLLYSIRHKRYNIKKNIKTRTYFSPRKKQNLQKLNKTIASVKKKHSRKNKTITPLQAHLKRVQTEMKNMSKEKLENQLKDHNISQGQSELIKEICNAAKIKNSKNRRYSENRMLLCLLFQTR